MSAAKPLVALMLGAAIALAAWLVLRGDAPARVEATSLVASGEGAVAEPQAQPPGEVEAPPREVSPSLEPAALAGDETEQADAEPASTEPVSLSLFGFLIPVEGQAIDSNVGISAVDRLGARESVRPSSDGAYAFPSLAPGSYWLSAGSPGAGHVELRVELTAADGDRRLDLKLALPPEVWIQVVDRDGEPVGGFAMLPVATLEPPGDWFTEVFGSFNNPFGVGQFWQSGFAVERLPAGYVGKLLLDVEPPVYVSLLNYQRVIETQRVEPGQREVEFVIDRDSPLVQGVEVRFHFVDAATGERVEGGGASLGGGAMRMMTPTDGEFRTPGVAPGWYDVMAQVQGYEWSRRRVLVEAGPLQDLGAIPLERAVWIAGTVVDDAGNGVAARMNVTTLDEATGEPVRYFVGMGAASAADGSFRIEGLSHATYLVSFKDSESPWARTCEHVDLRNGPVENLRIELARGVPLVVRSSRESFRDVRYRILDAAGDLVVSSQLWSQAPQPISLAPGSYTVEARVGKGEPTRHAITIATEPVELALP